MGSVKYLLKLCKVLSINNEVTVLTTKSKDIEYTNPFTAFWKEELILEEEKINNILIKRFKVENPNFLIKKINLGYIDRISNLLNIGLLSEFLYYSKLGPTSRGLENWLLDNFYKYDLILLSYFPYKIPYYYSKIMKKKNITFGIIPLYHENDPYHNRNFLKNSLKNSNIILELNQYSVDIFKKKFNKNSHNIRGYVEMPKIPNKKEIISFKREHDLLGKFIIILVCRKEPNKNYMMVIEAVEKIESDKVKIIFIGKDIDKKEINSKKVLYLKDVGDKILNKAFASSDILINMSTNESFGQVFLEALHYSLPVIGNSNCNQIKSLFENNKEGFFCKDLLELKEKIIFLKRNPKIKKKMGINGKRKLNREFSKKAFQKNIEGILEKNIKDKYFLIL